MQALRAMNTHAPIPRGLPALSALGLLRLGSSSPMPPCPLASRSPQYSVLRTQKSGLTFALLHRPPDDLHLCTVFSPLAPSRRPKPAAKGRPASPSAIWDVDTCRG